MRGTLTITTTSWRAARLSRIDFLTTSGLLPTYGFSEIYDRTSRTSKGRVLDLGCGGGELSLKLLHQGAAVGGVDISTTYIDGLRELGYETDLSW